MVKSYKNNFGEINENCITLIINNRKQTIDLNNLVKIRFVKRQKYHINYIAFVLSIYLLLFLKDNTLSNFFQLSIFLFTLILLGTSYFFKAYQYRFLLVKKNYFIDITVSKKMSHDAENLVNQINKKGL